MILVHILGAIGSLAAGVVFAAGGAAVWRDDRLAAGIGFGAAFLMAVSIVGHFGGMR